MKAKQQELNLSYRKSKYNKVKEEIDRKQIANWYELSTKDLHNQNTKFNYIDLFAGCGGLSLGIKQAGFNKIADVEILPFAVETLKYNFPEAKHYNGDISKFDVQEYTEGAKIHLVVGGPPCQGFSVAGKRNPEDERNFLFQQYHRVVKEIKPWFFILENVPGILTLKKGHYYEEIIKGFNELGYNVSVRILECADYGVPQLRSRAIFIGNRFGLKNPYPQKIYSSENYKTIDEAIKDLENMPRNPEINHEWTKHSPEFEARIAKVPPGGSLYETFRDAFKRQRVGHPSMTIKENHGGTHIHYKLNRCISTREMARLQTFPDDFIFKGTPKEGFKQVGNAVPPTLAKHIGLAVMESVKFIDSSEEFKRDS